MSTALRASLANISQKRVQSITPDVDGVTTNNIKMRPDRRWKTLCTQLNITADGFIGNQITRKENC